MSELNCDDLPGRLRDICRGHDDSGKQVLTPEKCERYRKFFLDGQFGSDHARAAAAVFKNPEAKEARRRAVVERAAQKRRLISWLKFLRHANDRGIGDTASRLIGHAATSPDAFAILERLLKQCSCTRTDAVSRLNQEYPYQDHARANS